MKTNNKNIKISFFTTLIISMIIYITILIYLGKDYNNYRYEIKLFFSLIYSLMYAIIISSIFLIYNIIKNKKIIKNIKLKIITTISILLSIILIGYITFGTIMLFIIVGP